MNKFFENLQHQAEENPMVAMGIGAALITSIGKLLNAKANHKNSKVWKREVDRRIKKTR